MQYNCWIITKDVIDEGEQVGVFCNPGSNRPPQDLPVRFKMYDDDRNLYFEGRMWEEDFEPLDDFGSSYGCTYLETSKNGKPFTVL